MGRLLSNSTPFSAHASLSRSSGEPRAAPAELVSRRSVISRFATALAGGVGAGLAAAPGCTGQASANTRTPDLIWGKKGLSAGRLMKPRAMTIDRDDRLYVVDMTGRIQIFDRDGRYLRGWRTPEIRNGRPTGLGIALDGSLLVADTHYFRVLVYAPDGRLQSERTIGGEFGNEPSQFHFVTDVVQDSRGHVLAGQYGQLDQIQEFDATGQFLRRWGRQGSDLGSFARPQGLLVDDRDQLWVADACNHRILVFRLDKSQAELVHSFGTSGNQPGQLQYPYGIAFDRDGTLLVAEYGNHRVQRFTTAGQSLEAWGRPGNQPGEFSSPWALVVDSRGAIHVLDTLNHRVQRFSA